MKLEGWTAGVLVVVVLVVIAFHAGYNAGAALGNSWHSVLRVLGHPL